MQVSTEHLALDENGVARIAGSRIKVRHLVMQTQLGLTPEQIHAELPHLSLAQIHAALAYYHDHRSTIDQEILQARETAESIRNSPEQAALVARIRERTQNQ